MNKFRSTEDIVSIKTVGRGSFGEVQKIHHKDDPNHIYALKIMKIRRPSELKYILKEIDLHKSLNHKNIIRCYDYFVDNDKAYIFLEYAEKGDLFKYMIRNDKISEEEILKMYVQVLEAFQYLHSKNILHRDLKPENILLDGEGNLKVCDFGWSAEYSDFEFRATLCGTCEYMAPEVIFHKRQTKKTDIWALGNKHPILM